MELGRTVHVENEINQFNSDLKMKKELSEGISEQLKFESVRFHMN